MEKLKLIKIRKIDFRTYFIYRTSSTYAKLCNPCLYKKCILTNFHFSSFFLSMTLQNAIIQIKFMYKKRGELSK